MGLAPIHSSYPNQGDINEPLQTYCTIRDLPAYSQWDSPALATQSRPRQRRSSFQHRSARTRPAPTIIPRSESVRHRFTSRRHFNAFALAATLLLATALTFTHSYFTSESGVAEALIAHVLHEPESLRANQAVPGVKLVSALAHAGGTLRGPIGEAVYYKRCPLPGGEGDHLALETPFGRATVLLLPKRARTATLAKHGFSAAVLPLGRGSVGVVADSPENLDRMSQLLHEQVAWEI